MHKVLEVTSYHQLYYVAFKVLYLINIVITVVLFKIYSLFISYFLYWIKENLSNYDKQRHCKFHRTTLFIFMF